MQIVINAFVSLCMVFFYETEVVTNLYFERKNNWHSLNIHVPYIYCTLQGRMYQLKVWTLSKKRGNWTVFQSWPYEIYKLCILCSPLKVLMKLLLWKGKSRIKCPELYYNTLIISDYSIALLYILINAIYFFLASSFNVWLKVTTIYLQWIS